jgi:hypothetical protein
MPDTIQVSEFHSRAFDQSKMYLYSVDWMRELAKQVEFYVNTLDKE